MDVGGIVGHNASKQSHNGVLATMRTHVLILEVQLLVHVLRSTLMAGCEA